MEKRKILFACDLDNTLFHSYKNQAEGDVCVEYINGNPQSYMSSASIRMLHTICQSDRVEFMPLTTRSIEQYRRIDFPDGCNPDYALVGNGTNLLVRDKIDVAWQQTSACIEKRYHDILMDIYQRCEKDSHFYLAKIVDGMFINAICETVSKLMDCANEYSVLAVENGLCANSSGRKLYIYPADFDKGESLSRFCDKFNFDGVLAAGDSTMDAGMLRYADAGISISSVLPYMQSVRLEDTVDGFGEKVLEWVCEQTDLAI